MNNSTVTSFPPLRTLVLQRVPHMAEPEYRGPEWRTVRIRALRPFRWRDQQHTRAGTIEPLGEPYVTEIGQVLTAIEPEADSLCALGWARRVE